jgi:drug/metabolite transporter (DMT)-like permease
MSFLVATMGIGSMMILPFYLWEVAEGGRIEGGLPAWLTLAYIAVFPSFIAYLFFNRGIELIGAARSGQSWHLMPVFGSILAVVFLGEQFYTYHAIGIALIAAGIVLASVKKGAAVNDRERHNMLWVRRGRTG